MEILDSKTDKELLQSLLAEIAKTNNEIKCARGDIEKAQGRVRFLIAVIHNLIDRQGD